MSRAARLPLAALLLALAAPVALAQPIMLGPRSHADRDAGRQLIEDDLAGQRCDVAEVLSEVRRTCDAGGLDALKCVEALSSAPARVVDLPETAAQPAELNTLQGQPVKQVAASVAQMLRQVATGSDVPQTLGVIDNLLPVNALGFLQSFGDLEEPQTLGYSHRLPVPGWVEARVSGFVTPIPKLNSLLKARLISDGNGAAAQNAEDSLHLGDDYFIAVDAALVNAWFGRRFEDNQVQGSHLLQASDDEDLAPKYRAAAISYDIRGPDTSHGADRRRFACGVAQLQRLHGEWTTRLSKLHINEFWKFVHNQPQLTVRYKRLHREDTVGADADSVRVWFGTGLANLTWLKLFGDCTHDLAGAKCAQSYVDELKSFRMRYGLGTSAYYEQGKIADVSVDLPLLEGVTNTLPNVGNVLTPTDNGFRISGGRYQRYGVALGMSLVDPRIGQPLATSVRLDFATDWYRYDNDPVRLDHDVMRLTLTWRRGTVSIPVHLMYRNRSEFEARLNDDLVVGIGSGLSF